MSAEAECPRQGYESCRDTTTAQARFWKQDLAELLQSAPRRGK